MVSFDLHNIKRYFQAKHKPADKIPDKSRDRVLSILAKNVRKSRKPLPHGPCNLCYIFTDRLIPVSLKLCNGCFKRFNQKTGSINLLKFEWLDIYCDWCLGKVFGAFSINPMIDKKCMDRLGRKHRFGIAEMKQRRGW